MTMAGARFSLTWALFSAVTVAGSLGMRVSTGRAPEWDDKVRSAGATESTSSTLTASEPSMGSVSPSQPDTPSSQPATANHTAEGGQQGLSPGEAAGVAIGTIAGVVAVGGGIFAGLKYSGRLGG